jgi:hypothetical protein
LIAGRHLPTPAARSLDSTRAIVDALSTVVVELQSHPTAMAVDDDAAAPHRCRDSCVRHWIQFDVWQRGSIDVV